MIDGGALLAYSSDVVISGCTLSENSAGQGVQSMWKSRASSPLRAAVSGTILSPATEVEARFASES